MLLINSKNVGISLLQFNNKPNNFSKRSSKTIVANNFIPSRSRNREGNRRTSFIKVSSSSSSAYSPLTSQNGSTAIIVPSSSTTATQPQNAVEVVRSFYAGINCHDIASLQFLIAENCVYEDLMFSHPFVGRQAFIEAYKNYIHSTSMDFHIVIDDITSNEESTSVGVAWHFEWKGKEFYFTRGCSFYRLEMVEGTRQIVYGRDVVEPSIKLGKATLVLIKGMTWLLQKFPQLEDHLCL